MLNASQMLMYSNTKIKDKLKLILSLDFTEKSLVTPFNWFIVLDLIEHQNINLGLENIWDSKNENMSDFKQLSQQLCSLQCSFKVLYQILRDFSGPT